MMKKMTTAIYARASTSEEKQNLQIQLHPCIERCKFNSWDYVIYQEFASGAKESRPQLDLMMQAIRQGKHERLLVLRLDRLGRSLKHLLQILEELRNLKVTFISIHESFDTSTAHGELFFNISASYAQFERKLTQERIKDGLKEARRKGKLFGRPVGKKDSKPRRRSGYWLRWADKKKIQAE